MKEILGKKVGMTRLFRPGGDAVSVTVIEAGPCPVIRKKTRETDGYSAYQVGFGVRKKSRITKPWAGQFAKANQEPSQYLRELRFDEADLEVGGELKADVFKAGEFVDVTGISRGLGFAGGMKRHHFQGANKTHGQSDRWRAPGSIGQSSYPSRVFKGMRMAGRMGGVRTTTQGLTVHAIDADRGLLLIKGAVPGPKGGLLVIRSAVKSGQEA